MCGRYSFFLVLVLCCSISAAKEAVEIPLSEVWALHMPGTKDLSATTDESPVQHTTPKHIVIPQRKLLEKPPEAEAMSGLAVYGTGRRALTFASIGLATRNPDVCSPLYSTEEISIAFFSHPCNYNIYLDHVERRGNVIKIRYRCVPHYTPEVTVHLALIPLGKLPAGVYQVEITQAPLDQKYLDAGFEPLSTEAAQKIVCQPFSFTVEDPPSPELKLSDDAVVIPLSEVWGWRIPGTKPMSAGQRGGEYTAEEGPLLEEIRKRLSGLPGVGEEKKAEAGFIVAGTGMEAMKKAHAILMGKEDRRNDFEVDQELSLVFFTYRSTSYIHLHDIVIEDHTIRVRFKFIPHRSREVTNHFALIPISGLKGGKYEVLVERLPLEQKYVKAGVPPRPTSSNNLVSSSFSFSVKESTKQAGQHKALLPQPAGENHED